MWCKLKVGVTIWLNCKTVTESKLYYIFYRIGLKHIKIITITTYQYYSNNLLQTKISNMSRIKMKRRFFPYLDFWVSISSMVTWSWVLYFFKSDAPKKQGCLFSKISMYQPTWRLQQVHCASINCIIYSKYDEPITFWLFPS